nr:GTP cyclohydrolase I [Pseudomonas putida]
MSRSLAENYREILVGVGENPQREGLLDTPQRAARESPNKPSVMRESPQHLIRAAHEPDELFRL